MGPECANSANRDVRGAVAAAKELRLEEAKLGCLAVVGVRADGTKELVAITDGHRESTESWADLLRDLKRRGMPAPMVAVGDGTLGSWAALRTV